MRSLVTLAVVCALATSASATEIQSGLKIGESPKAFQVVDITGPSAGLKKTCYRCNYGSKPVVNVFVRKLDENTKSLIQELNKAVGKNADSQLKSFVVMLTDTPDSQSPALRQLAKEQKLTIPLTVYENANGPRSYKLSEEADVTVLMWVDSEVKVNHAVKAASLDKAAISKIVSDTQKILK